MTHGRHRTRSARQSSSPTGDCGLARGPLQESDRGAGGAACGSPLRSGGPQPPMSTGVLRRAGQRLVSLKPERGWMADSTVQDHVLLMAAVPVNTSLMSRKSWGFARRAARSSGGISRRCNEGRKGLAPPLIFLNPMETFPTAEISRLGENAMAIFSCQSQPGRRSDAYLVLERLPGLREAAPIQADGSASRTVPHHSSYFCSHLRCG